MRHCFLLCCVLATLPLAAFNPIDFVHAELAKGNRHITVPPGQYRIMPPEGRKAYLELENLEQVTVDFTGVEIVGKRRTRMVDLKNCRKVTLRGLTVDYETLPFTQATITGIDDNGTWEVKIIPGYPAEDIISSGIFWPIQVYGRDTHELVNPMRFRENIAIERTGKDTYRISGGIDKRGSVGDIAVWSLSEPKGVPVNGSAIALTRCADILLEDITVYSTPRGCGFIDMYGDGNTYKRCRLIRRPPENDLQKRAVKRLRSGNHDAFMSRCASRGPRYLDCVAMYHCDDCVNIGGMYAFITQVQGNDVRIAINWGGFNFRVGDPCELLTFDGQCHEGLTVVAIKEDGDTTDAERRLFQTFNLWTGLANSCRKAYRLTLNRPLDSLQPGSMLISSRRYGSDFLISGCHFGHSRARGLIINASDGLIENNIIEHCHASAIRMAPSHTWMEGGCASRVTVRNNTLVANGGTSIVVSGVTGARKPMPVNAHKQLAFTGNKILQAKQGLEVTGCTGLVLRDNVFQVTAAPKPITLVNTQDVIQENNTTLPQKNR